MTPACAICERPLVEGKSDKGVPMMVCPLHAAAEEMREALADLLDLGRAGFVRGEDIAVTRAVERARALLAKVGSA